MESLGNIFQNFKILLNNQFINKEPWQIVTITSTSVLTLVYIYETLIKKTNNPFENESLSKQIKKKIFKLLKKIPMIKKKIEEESANVVDLFEKDIRDSNKNLDYILYIPENGFNKDQIMNLVHEHLKNGHYDWKQGRVSGAIYYFDQELIDLLTEVFGLTSYTNPLHPDIFPGICKMEAEVIKICANLFHGNSKTCGSMTSGGTESIMMACKAYRDYGREEKGIQLPEIVLPVTAHPAFDKAASYFGMKIKHIKLSDNYVVDINAMEKSITRNTVMLVGSVPNFPYGTVDDIEKIAALGIKYDIPVHVDCCLGGFLIPFMGSVGFPLAPFDFQLNGVTSISVDTHKYGFTPKGSSVVLYSELKYKHSQYFVTSDWPGGNYGSPTVSGSRSGGIIATCWATLLHFGFEGYKKTTYDIVKTTKWIEFELRKLPSLFLFGFPKTSVIAIGSTVFHIYRLSSALNKKGWNVNCLQFPVGIHICITHLHTKENVAVQLIDDIKEAIEEIMKNPNLQLEGVMAMYGKSHSIPDRSIIGDFTRYYIDATYYTPSIDDKLVNDAVEQTKQQNGVVKK